MDVQSVPLGDDGAKKRARGQEREGATVSEMSKVFVAMLVFLLVAVALGLTCQHEESKHICKTCGHRDFRHTQIGCVLCRCSVFVACRKVRP